MPDPENPMSDELELAGKVLQELGPPAREFVAQVTGSATHELGEALADRARLRRFRNQIKILTKAQQAAAEAGLPASVVPVKVLAPLLEFGALEEEDDEDMVSRWANLLANAATESVVRVPPSFPDILRQLEPVDARILDLLHEKAGSPAAIVSPVGGGSGWSAAIIEHYAEFPKNTVTQARLENLVRLGVAFHPLERAPGTPPHSPPTVNREDITLSALGAAFVRACLPPEQPTPSD